MQDKSGWAGRATAACHVPAPSLLAPALLPLLLHPILPAGAYLMSAPLLPRSARCARWGNLINTLVLVILMAAAGQYNKPYK